MRSIGRFQHNNWFWSCLFFFLAWQTRNGWAANVAIQSDWDVNLLTVELGHVSTKANTMADAWQDIATKYLLRANLYMDTAAISNDKPFVFHKENATGKDLLDGFLTTYSSFTYTQNPGTGIIWIYPKSMNYNDILNQKIKVIHGTNDVPMYADIYVPLCKLLAPNVIDSSDSVNIIREWQIDPSTHKPYISYSWFYDVNLPPGVYSAREILDFCCVANPTKSFLIRPDFGRELPFLVFLEDLVSRNPLAPPRAEAIAFWELRIGKTTNGIPSLDEIRAAMSNPNPEKRSAASLYLEASQMNYAPIDLIGKADGADQAVWTTLGVENALFRDALWSDKRAHFFTELTRRIPKLREDLEKIKSPDLALLTSLQLMREKLDTSYLDAIVTNHTYSEAEIVSIKPELYRMARSSKVVRDKLKEMIFQVPELEPEVLDELANTNILMFAPAENN